MVIPLLAFAGAGTLWLYEHKWLGWAGFVFLCGEALALFLFRKWNRQAALLLPQPSIAPPPEFAPRDEEAWKVVHEYLERIDTGELVLSSKEQLMTLGQEILERVAAHYHPRAEEPLLAVQVPLLFRAIEETARDLATITTELPLAHKITIGDALRGYRIHKRFKPAYDAYRTLYPLFNWKNALFQVLVTDRLFDLTKETLSQWLLKWYIDRLGYHAIELYSGKLLLTQRYAAAALFTPSVASETEPVVAPQLPPLRFLIVGQVKAGKSSVANGLFGEMRAATDVLPTTTGLTTYTLADRRFGTAVVVSDMGGYEDPTVPRERVDAALQAALHADILLFVCAANSAAREPDRQLLARIRQTFTQHPEKRPPCMLVVLTHIDRLRPQQEWLPPYNVVHPDGPKARAIRGAVDTVAAELGLPAEVVIPVCSLPEHLYNIQEALVPLLIDVLPEAKRTLLLRHLQTAREKEQWELLGQQARAAGRFLFQLGSEVVKKSLARVLIGG